MKKSFPWHLADGEDMYYHSEGNIGSYLTTRNGLFQDLSIYYHLGKPTAVSNDDQVVEFNYFTGQEYSIEIDFPREPRIGKIPRKYHNRGSLTNITGDEYKIINGIVNEYTQRMS